MANRCSRAPWGGSHASTLVPCDFCDQLAAFHWRRTYPDLLLCREHIDMYDLVEALEKFVPGSLCESEM